MRATRKRRHLVSCARWGAPIVAPHMKGLTTLYQAGDACWTLGLRTMRVGVYKYYPRCQSRLSLSSPLFTAAWGWVSPLSKLGDDMLELL